MNLTALAARDLEIALSLLIAAVLGGIVGFERQRSHHAAGLRTLMLISVGAAAFAAIGKYAFEFSTDATSRVVANIITGIGFLGAGAVFRSERAVRGLTTAASVWVVAAVGTAVGLGMYFVGASIVLIALFALNVLHRIEPRLDSGVKKESPQDRQ